MFRLRYTFYRIVILIAYKIVGTYGLFFYPIMIYFAYMCLGHLIFQSTNSPNPQGNEGGNDPGQNHGQGIRRNIRNLARGERLPPNAQQRIRNPYISLRNVQEIQNNRPPGENSAPNISPPENQIPRSPSENELQNNSNPENNSNIAPQIQNNNNPQNPSTQLSNFISSAFNSELPFSNPMVLFLSQALS